MDRRDDLADLKIRRRLERGPVRRSSLISPVSAILGMRSCDKSQAISDKTVCI
jgi:hypothetical protein